MLTDVSTLPLSVAAEEPRSGAVSAEAAAAVESASSGAEAAAVFRGVGVRERLQKRSELSVFSCRDHGSCAGGTRTVTFCKRVSGDPHVLLIVPLILSEVGNNKLQHSLNVFFFSHCCGD